METVDGGTAPLARVRSRRRRQVEAEIRAECERDCHTMWTDARWYEVLDRDEIQAIVSEYGYGPLRDSRTGKPEWALSERRA